MNRPLSQFLNDRIFNILYVSLWADFILSPLILFASIRNHSHYDDNYDYFHIMTFLKFHLSFQSLIAQFEKKRTRKTLGDFLLVRQYDVVPSQVCHVVLWYQYYVYGDMEIYYQETASIK